MKIQLTIFFMMSFLGNGQLITWRISGDTLYCQNPSTGTKYMIMPPAAGQSGKMPTTDGTNFNWVNVNSALVGLGNADNTSDANKPVSTAQQTALNLKANLASPTFTGTVAGITPTMVGLGNVTNESKATMFTSPVFTGTPTGIGLPVYARVTGSNATTTGQALVDITGLTAALVANATYEIEANISCQTTAVTTGTQYGVQYSAAGSTIEGQIMGSFTSTAAKAERISTINTASSAFLTTSAQTGAITITATVTTGVNAGTLSIRHLKVTSGTSTVIINSRLKVTRIL